ncbi:MAG: YlbF family regulator [Lachnospiraceae bacterium]|nr:YlbF family regulator [Lachnospiraceae bacterium]
MNMKELELATALFRDALHETKVYQEYLDAKEALKQDKERWETLQQYRKKRYEIQQLAGGDELYERMESFVLEEQQYRMNPQVAAFLDAELALCRMMQEIFFSMVDSLDFE